MTPPRSHRTCLRCKDIKPRDEFRSLRARRCLACDQDVWGDAPTACIICEGPLPAPGPRSYEPRIVCDQRECQRAVQAYNARVAARRLSRQAAAVPLPDVRHCAQCDRDLPLTQEHFYVGHSGAPSKRFDHWCKECRKRRARARHARDRDRINQRDRERQRQRLAEMPAEQREVLRERERARSREAQRRFREQYPERAAAYKRAYRERVKQDPEKHARMRETARLGSRLLREQKDGVPVTDQRAPILRDRAPRDRIRRLPAAPLAAVVRRAVDRRVALGEDVETICVEYGITDRTLRAWEPGSDGSPAERELVRFDTADTILTALGLFWWDVWTADGNSDHHLQALRVWEGEDAYLEATEGAAA